MQLKRVVCFTPGHYFNDTLTLLEEHPYSNIANDLLLLQTCGPAA